MAALLRGLAWALLAFAALAFAYHRVLRRRLRARVRADVAAVERRVFWDKDEIYDAPGRVLLARAAFALEVTLAAALASGLLFVLTA